MPGKKKFPDLTGDGKVTKADILKGRGVEGFEKGGKVDLDKLPRKMKERKYGWGFGAGPTVLKENRTPKTKEERAGRTPEEKIKARTTERDRKKFEKKTQQQMGSFKDGGKVKVERINKKGRTAAVEKMLRRLGEMKQGSIQEKYPTKGNRTKPRPAQFEKHRDPGAVERMMEFERSAREAGFKDGGSVCAGGRSAIQGKKFSGTY